MESDKLMFSLSYFQWTVSSALHQCINIQLFKQSGHICPLKTLEDMFNPIFSPFFEIKVFFNFFLVKKVVNIFKNVFSSVFPRSRIAQLFFFQFLYLVNLVHRWYSLPSIGHLSLILVPVIAMLLLTCNPSGSCYR